MKRDNTKQNKQVCKTKTTNNNEENVIEYVDDQIIAELSTFLIKKNIIAYKELAK